MTLPLALRPATPADDQLLFAIYASTRMAELEQLPWTDEQKSAFVLQQHLAQHSAYHGRHPDGQFLVIELDGAAVGRLYRATLDGGEIRLLDIALLPEHCGHGLGSALLRGLMVEADVTAAVLSLHVEFWNPALRLYQRLGFVEAARNDVHVRMEYVPLGGASVS